MKHLDTPELLETMKVIYENVSYNLAMLQHSDWDDSTCIFDLSHRNKFIQTLLDLYDTVPRECGMCMYLKTATIAETLRSLFWFYGMDADDRFAEAVQIQLFNAVMPYHDDLRKQLNEATRQIM